MSSRQGAIPVASVKIRKKSDAKGAKNDNMKKRLQRICSCVLLCAALLAAALPAPAAASSTGFSDVPESHWAADAIRRAVDLGLFNGQTKTRFGLGQPMTRAAAVVTLCRLFGWETVTPEKGSYQDNQDPDTWYYSAVETTYAHGAITHQTDTFRPEDPIAREELAVANAVPTAEGAVQIAMEQLPITIHGARVLVVGFGRVGRALAQRLAALGAKVTVAARRYESLAWAQASGYGAEQTGQLAGWLCGYDLVVNTVPTLVLGEAELADLKPDCLVLDLASKPGGVDLEAAGRLGRTVIWALSLPGKVAPVTAGSAIKNTIYHMLHELGA